MTTGFWIAACLQVAGGLGGDSPAARVQDPTLATASPVVAVPANPASAPDGCCTVVAGSMLQLEIDEPISSRLRQRGETFALHLAEPLSVEGRLLLPAGTPGRGEIIHAARSGSGGKAGELLLAARYLEFEGQRVPLRGFRLGASGKDQSAAALAASIAVGPMALFIRGREIEIPAGTRANAKVAADVPLPPTPAPPPQQEPTE